jgi:hypothetical protein
MGALPVTYTLQQDAASDKIFGEAVSAEVQQPCSSRAWLQL